MSKKEIQNLSNQIDKLSPMEFSKLCLKVIKKIMRRQNSETIENSTEKNDKRVLIDLMIKNDIKIDEKEEKIDS